MTSLRRLLFAVGCCVLVMELLEDIALVAQARDAGWDAFSLRMVGGHALREFLVVAALIALYTNAVWMVPFALGAAAHGLFFRTGFFLGAGEIPWGSTQTWVTAFDMCWRLGLLAWGVVQLPAVWADMRGKEA